MNQDWKKDPKLNHMDPAKLQLLQSLAEQGNGKNMSDMLPFLISAASQGKQKGLDFTSSEQQLILEVLKQGKSPAEAAKIDKIVSLLSMIR